MGVTALWFVSIYSVLHGACICVCICVCCVHQDAGYLLCTAGQGSSNTKEQEVIDLQVNNEALLCMLERERQHSQCLAEALQQAEANSLEVSLYKLTEEPRWLVLPLQCMLSLTGMLTVLLYISGKGAVSTKLYLPGFMSIFGLTCLPDECITCMLLHVLTPDHSWIGKSLDLVALVATLNTCLHCTAAETVVGPRKSALDHTLAS